jgi:hypothetical protein
MSLSPNDELKLTSEDVSNLTDDNLILPTAPGSTKRKVSTAFLTPPTTASTSSSVGATVRHVSSSGPAPGGFVDLPIFLDSADTLQICGFNNVTANTIYSKFINKAPNSTNTLMSYAVSQVAVLKHPNVAAMTNQQLLTHIGFSDKMKAVFAKPEHANILQTEPLHYWVVETILGNYRSIINMQERVKEAAQKSNADKKEGKKEGKKAKIETLTPTATVSGYVSRGHLTGTFVTTGPTPGPKPGHKYLLKGKSSGALYGNGKFINENGDVNVLAISSDTQGDWNGSRRQYYFAEDLEAAEEYRRLAADLFENEESWIIHAQVPDSYHTTLERQNLYWGHDHKWFTWMSRSAETISPTHDLKKYDDASLLVGHMTKSASIARIEKQRVQDDFKEEHLLTIDGRKMVQWCFDEECAAGLNEALRGNLHVDVFPPLARGHAWD